ncbi:MAG: legumain [Bacteroidales bacterium]|nr:legumain [Bacteroidales bacterium]
MGWNKSIFVWVMSLVLCVSCNKEQGILPEDTMQWETRKVAVVLPMQNGLDKHWRRTLNQCAEDLKQAFAMQQRGIALEYEWYDEDSEDLEQLADELSKRKEVVGVIGGYHSDNAKKLASRFCRSQVKKTFFTLATTEELVRGFSSAGCLWAMTETDIAQCEVLLAKAYAYGAKSVGLIADGSSLYGKTFVDWFAFQAKEMGMEVTGIYDYAHSSVDKEAAKAAASGTNFLICAPNDIEGIRKIQEAMHRQAAGGLPIPRCLYSDIAYGADVVKLLGASANGLEGVCVGADPESGFDVCYETTYGEQATNGEAQVYDAAMMVGYGCYLQLLHEHLYDKQLALDEALKILVDGRGDYQHTWSTKGMSDFITELTQGKTPDLRGVSGTLDFDKKVYTNILNSIYHHYMVYDGQYIILDYNASNSSERTSETLAGWNWKNDRMQELEECTSTDYTYPALHERWALLVASSSGWNNYRHQADVYYMYQLLRGYGYEDDHIVLIAEDDIAYNKNNPNQGMVNIHLGGSNVYEDLTIDYHPSELVPEDVKSILCGEESERLPHVISADEDDNVFFFWSGHGIPEHLMWLNNRRGLSRELAQEIFASMHEKKCYRKLLCLIETCYSGSVFDAVEGLPGILAITAANANETSKADVYNCDLEVWMSNRFTLTFQDCIVKNPSITMRELYYRLFNNTVGSHVTVFNEENYGNMYTNTMREFLE